MSPFKFQVEHFGPRMKNLDAPALKKRRSLVDYIGGAILSFTKLLIVYDY